MRLSTLNTQLSTQVRRALALAFILAASALADPPPGYYDAVNGLTGAALKNGLRPIISSGHTPIPYDGLFGPLRAIWQDPNNSSNILLFYSSASVSKNASTWNREHLWPRSRGVSTDGGPDDSDLFHVVPCDSDVNSTRGTLYFDTSSAADGGIINPAQAEAPLCTRDNNSWEPQPSQRGDVARAILYMATRYDGAEPGTNDLEVVKPNPGASQMANLDTLLAWNAADPVDNAERARNDLIYTTYQHNRNPFIDHPEWVTLIWGNSGAGMTALAQATDVSAVESPNTTGVYLVQLSAAAPAGGLTVSFAMTGTASTADYTLAAVAGANTVLNFNPGTATGTFTIPAGVTSGSIILTAMNDGTAEAAERAQLTVTAGAGYTAIGGAAQVTISDQPPPAPPGAIATWDFNAPAFSDPITATSGAGAVRLDEWAGTIDSFGGYIGQSLALVAGTGLVGNGSHIDIEFSSIGYKNLSVTFWTRGTSTGFNSGTWSWSTNGVNFTNVPGVNTATRNTDFEAVGEQLVDLTTFTPLNNATNVVLRYTLSGATSGSGNNRIDEMVIHATPLPRISVVASDADAHETGANVAAFTVTSDSFASTGGLSVAFAVGGTATPGTDYTVGGASSFNAGAGTGTILIPEGATSAGLTFTPLADSNPLEFDESLSVQVSPANGQYALGTPPNANATLHDATPYNAAWAARFPALTPAQAVPTLDLDLDGLNNLLEFAFDTDPLAPEVAFAPVLGSALFPDPLPGGPSQRFATLTFLRRIDTHAPAYTPQATSMLGNWPGVPVFVGTTAGPTSATERVTYRTAQPMTGPNAVPQTFLRVLVTAAP